MSSFSRVAAIALACTILIPAASIAQVGGNEASITGVVKDPSGAVLPGVTVDVTSAVLIEKTRSAVTDGSGQYRVTALPPGTYSVTFTLNGFSTMRREGVVLEGSLTATVSESLRVGTVTETVTVTGETPIVDVQSAKVRQVITSDTISEIPTARVYHSIANLVASVTSSNQSDVGGINGPATVTFSAHGGRSNEGRLQVDGQSVGASLNGSGVSYYVADIGNAAEVTFSVSGGMGEAEVGGPVMSVVPRTGGNTFRGTIFANGASAWMGSENVNAGLLRDASVSGSVGVTQGNTLLKIWDLNDTVGGPIVKDRLWFYGGFRYQGNRKLVAPG